MALTEFNGSILTTAVEQNLFDITALKHFATTIYNHNMVAGDEVEIKVFVKDVNAAVMRTYRTKSLKGVQSNPAFFIPFLPTSQYRVTIRRVLGVDRIFTWTRYEQ